MADQLRATKREVSKREIRCRVLHILQKNRINKIDFKLNTSMNVIKKTKYLHVDILMFYVVSNEIS